MIENKTFCFLKKTLFVKLIFPGVAGCEGCFG